MVPSHARVAWWYVCTYVIYSLTKQVIYGFQCTLCVLNKMNRNVCGRRRRCSLTLLVLAWQNSNSTPNNPLMNEIVQTAMLQLSHYLYPAPAGTCNIIRITTSSRTRCLVPRQPTTNKLSNTTSWSVFSFIFLTTCSRFAEFFLYRLCFCVLFLFHTLC